jgi:Icc-related predicted phosphoesterase
MNLWVISDLHVDVADYELAPTPDGADVLVIAGDIGSRLTKRCLPWIARHALPRGLPVIYVPGNHDYYGVNITTEIPKAHARAAELGIHLLAEGESVIIEGVRFVGGTLWTDHQIWGNGPVSQNEAARWMNDHRKIRWGSDYRRFLPVHALAAHRTCRDAIGAVLAASVPGPTVVVTHHAPHPRSLRQGRAAEPLDGAYVSDLSGFIGTHHPDLWIHGHIHENRNYTIHGTRILSNPRGYVMRTRMGPRTLTEVENPDHDPGCVVEV